MARVRILIAVSALLACSSDVTAPNLPSRPPGATALALGARFSCAVTSDGAPYCWGDNLTGELGDSTFSTKFTPTASAGARSYIALAAGVGSACALDHGGGAWCWGDDPTQPGVAVSYRNVAVAVHAPRPLVTITAGRKVGCGLDTDGNAYCWGENGRGQLGVGDTLPHATPTRVVGGIRFTSISTGFWSTCAVSTAGKAYCWGDNSYGELGTGDTVRSMQPRQVVGATQFRSVTLGSIHACGISTAGSAFCWGANFSGQLGDGTGTQRLAPVASAAGLTFTSLRASRANSIYTHTCGITPAGDAYCWGWNSKGQLGVPTSTTTDACTPFTPPGVINTNPVTMECSYTAVKAAGVSSVVSLDAGERHSCALTSSSALLCWGDNTYGELGDGTGVSTSSPVAVKGNLKFP